MESKKKLELKFSNKRKFNAITYKIRDTKTTYSPDLMI